MVRILDLVRHAEASESAGNERDIERELTSTGMRHANMLGRYLLASAQGPKKIIASKARRSETTAILIADCLGYSEDDIEYTDELYNGSVRTYLKLVNELSDECEHVMVVAHNPVITYLCEYITGESINAMAPGSIARLQFNGSWSEISQNSCSLLFVKEPENLL